MPEIDTREVVKSAASKGGARHFLHGVDHRTATARRMRDLHAEIMEDRGGELHLSTSEKQLARRIACIAVACEILEAEFLQSGDLDTTEYLNLSATMARIMAKLGIRRTKREVNIPRLHDYIHEAS
jgi:hypothetical protein